MSKRGVLASSMAVCVLIAALFFSSMAEIDECEAANAKLAEQITELGMITKVTNAIQVLKVFYKESGMIAKEPLEFVQIRSHRDVELPDSPDTWDSSYTGGADPKNGSDGVLSILDGVMQKFGAMDADAKVQDDTVQKNYEGDMRAQKIELVGTTRDGEMEDIGHKHPALIAQLAVVFCTLSSYSECQMSHHSSCPLALTPV